MNTVGTLFFNTAKAWPNAPDLLGKFTLTEAFLKACVEGWRAHRAAEAEGPCVVTVEARKAQGQAIEFYRVNFIPPKVPK